MTCFGCKTKAKISIRADFFTTPLHCSEAWVNLSLSHSRSRKIPPVLTACIRVTTNFEVTEKIRITDYRGHPHVDVRSYACWVAHPSTLRGRHQPKFYTILSTCHARVLTTGHPRRRCNDKIKKALNARNIVD